MRLLIPILLVATVVLAACGGAKHRAHASAPASAYLPSSGHSALIVHEPGATMDSEHAGDLIMTKLVGPTPSADELTQIHTHELGAVILFGWNVQNASQLSRLASTLQAARGSDPLLVSVDQEGGSIRNVPFAPPAATEPQLGNGSVDAARQEAHATGVALSAVGVNMDLGPVADLASPPNRTMAGRAFGSVGAQVAPFVSATVTGMLNGGVIPTAKHFPGFGASTANSDDGVAYIDRTRAQLDANELLTFRAAVAAHDPVIMVSHGILRAQGRTLPGTVDPYVATKLLRNDLHFDGVAMTDSMNAKGFRDAWGKTVPQACPAAIAAGMDLVLLTGSLETATLCRKRILEALADGSLPHARFYQAVCRVDALRTAITSGHITDVSFAACDSDPSPAATAARPAT